MKKLFLDTNLYLRFFLKDNESQYQSIYNLFEKIEEGKFKPYTSSIVFLELNYVARNIYKLSLGEVLGCMDAVRKMRGMTVIEKTYTNRAINLYKKYKIKLGDCFIAVQAPEGAMFATYDEDFKKIKEVDSQTPEEILEDMPYDNSKRERMRLLKKI